MEIISGTSEFYIEKDTAVAIGKFDGVHLGHRRLLEEVLKAKKRGLLACVFTFDKPPAALFGGDTKVITTCEEKRRILEHIGIDVLVEFPMNLDTAKTPAADFITQYLVNQMNTRLIVAGPDVSFGAGGAGNAQLLTEMSKDCGYELMLIDKVKIGDGEEISSTVIRKSVETGNMQRAEEMLGVPYTFIGKIEHGNHLGSGMGFPTLNLYPAEEKILPPYGVYLSETVVDGRIYCSISNIGRKPTVNSSMKVSVETYLYDFDGDIYGKEAQVSIREFMRPERKFDGLEELKKQLEDDISYGRQVYFA